MPPKRNRNDRSSYLVCHQDHYTDPHNWLLSFFALDKKKPTLNRRRPKLSTLQASFWPIALLTISTQVVDEAGVGGPTTRRHCQNKCKVLSCYTRNRKRGLADQGRSGSNDRNLISLLIAIEKSIAYDPKREQLWHDKVVQSKVQQIFWHRGVGLLVSSAWTNCAPWFTIENSGRRKGKWIKLLWQGHSEFPIEGNNAIHMDPTCNKFGIMKWFSSRFKRIKGRLKGHLGMGKGFSRMFRTWFNF